MIGWTRAAGHLARACDRKPRGEPPLRLRGAGTKDFYGELATATLLEHARLQRRGRLRALGTGAHGALRHAAVGDRRACWPQQRQFLAFEPPAFGGDPTIGGIIASGSVGSAASAGRRRARFRARARCCWRADGELLHFGGKVMKNVAGFDVARLLCGSLGILGAIPRCR